MADSGYPPIEESLRDMDECMDLQVRLGKAVPDLSHFDKAIRKAQEEFMSLTCEDQARQIVFDYVRFHLDPTDRRHATFALDEVYVVLFTYVVGNWKASVSTSLPDGMYYEVTYDKRRGVAYLDAYKRFDHKEIAIPIPGR